MNAEIYVVVSVACAALPSIGLLSFFYFSDRFREPASVVGKTFILGALLVVGVRVYRAVHGWFQPEIVDDGWAALYTAFLVAAIPEETLKLAVLFIYPARHSAFDEPMDGIVYGAAASLGFATYENISYVLQGGWTVALARSVTTVPAHAFFGAILGMGVARSKLAKGQWGGVVYGWGLSVALHGFYDFPLIWLRNMQRSGGLVDGTAESFAWSIGLFSACLLAVCIAAGIVVYQNLTYREQQRGQ